MQLEPEDFLLWLIWKRASDTVLSGASLYEKKKKKL